MPRYLNESFIASRAPIIIGGIGGRRLESISCWCSGASCCLRNLSYSSWSEGLWVNTRYKVAMGLDFRQMG